jgi:hypothetical protein
MEIPAIPCHKIPCPNFPSCDRFSRTLKATICPLLRFPALSWTGFDGKLQWQSAKKHEDQPRQWWFVRYIWHTMVT